MALDQFNQIYALWHKKKNYLDRNSSILEQKVEDEKEEAAKVEMWGREATPSLVDHSPRAEKVYRAAEQESRYLAFMANYIKTNFDEALNGDAEKVIRATALCIDSDPKSSELALYLFAYKQLDLLKEENPNKEVSRWERKQRITREQRETIPEMLLPILIKEAIRFKHPEYDDAKLEQGVADNLPFAHTSRTFIPGLVAKGQEWIMNRIKAIGTVKDYVKSNLQDADPKVENQKYANFAYHLGEAYSGN